MNRDGIIPISVLMSCYNASRWLKESIESVINQSYSNYEFIIIDDGSNDETKKIIEEYAKKDSRIIPIYKNNTGLADSLNIGISLARGQWIARIDADDICEYNRLERQLIFAKINKGYVFIGTGMKEIDEHGNIIKVYKFPLTHEKLVFNLEHGKKFPPHSSALIKTEAARILGGYRTRIKRAEDYDMWLRLSEIGQLACLPEPLVRVRKHKYQISNEDSGKKQKLDSSIAIISYYLRKNGYLDPVDANDLLFNRFRLFVERGLNYYGVFNIFNSYMDLKQMIRTKNWLAALFYIIKNPVNLLSIIKLYLMTSRYPKRIAISWLRIIKEESYNLNI